jgi:hypothetical protein
MANYTREQYEDWINGFTEDAFTLVDKVNYLHPQDLLLTILINNYYHILDKDTDKNLEDKKEYFKELVDVMVNSIFGQCANESPIEPKGTIQ